jgi:LacI family transcriptional regulator
VGGAILMGLTSDDVEVQRLGRSSLPCVSVDVELEGEQTSWVSSDSTQGARLAVKHLRDLGHKRIAHIAGPQETTPGMERLRGFQRSMQSLGLSYFDELVAYGDYYYDSGREAMVRLLEADEPPTAVFAASDMMAMGAMRAIQAAGLTVPDDIAVVGFDDIQVAAVAHPPLTTIRQEKGDLGTLAAETLLRRIESGEDTDTHLTLPVTLVARQSTLGEQGLSGS